MKTLLTGIAGSIGSHVAEAQRLLDYRPSMPFADGVAAQVRWQKGIR